MDTSSLMEQILSEENLKAAYLQVVRNKGAAGVDDMTVEELGDYLSENGESIKEQLRKRKFKPQPVRRVEIPKPDGGVRNLGVPTVIDRFVQQAVLTALEMMNDGHSWIVDIDLAKFFDTVDHDKLMTIFGRTIKDGDVISVVRKFLVSGAIAALIITRMTDRLLEQNQPIWYWLNLSGRMAPFDRTGGSKAPGLFNRVGTYHR